MRKINSKKAFSLLELIIASGLVSVVVLGIFAINSVLNNNGQDFGQRYLVKSSTQTTLNHILNNASLAIGSGTTISGNGTNYPDQGIVWGNDSQLGWGDSNSFCIHQAANNNIINSGSDIWLCYTWYPSSNQNYPNQIYYCTMSYNTSQAYRGAGSCISSSTNFQFLGTAYSISNPSPPTFNTTTGVFTITIQNCLNNSNSAQGCNSSGVSTSPINNPETQVSGSVIPPQEGLPQN